MAWDSGIVAEDSGIVAAGITGPGGAAGGAAATHGGVAGAAGGAAAYVLTGTALALATAHSIAHPSVVYDLF